MTTTHRWALGLVVPAVLSTGTYCVNSARTAHAAHIADYEAHKVENAADIATTQQALREIDRRLERIENMIDERLPRRYP
jgi:hypothetical protein